MRLDKLRAAAVKRAVKHLQQQCALLWRQLIPASQQCSEWLDADDWLDAFVGETVNAVSSKRAQKQNPLCMTWPKRSAQVSTMLLLLQ
jgi:hypothetical protein